MAVGGADRLLGRDRVRHLGFSRGSRVVDREGYAMKAPDLTSPKKMLRWAQEEISEIEDLFLGWGAGQFIQPGVRLSSDGATLEIYIVSVEDLPDRIERLVNNAATSIRHAFDQSTYAVVTAVHGEWNGDQPSFPWRQSPADLEKWLNKFELPEPYRRALRDMRPYNSVDGVQDGDDLLRDFAKAVNPAKHEAIFRFNGHLIPQSFNLHFEGGGETGLRAAFTTGMFPVMVGKTFATVSGNIGIVEGVDAAFGCQLSFIGTPHLESQPVLTVLGHAHSQLQRLLFSLEAAAAQITD